MTRDPLRPQYQRRPAGRSIRSLARTQAVGALALAGCILLSAAIPWSRPLQAAAVSPPGEDEVVALTLTPPSAAVVVGGLAQITVQVDAGRQAVDGVQIEVQFPPDLLQVEDADPTKTGVQINGSSTLPTVLFNAADNRQGLIRYAAGVDLGSGDVSSGSFVLATVAFRTRTTGAAAVRFGGATKAASHGASLPVSTTDGALAIQPPGIPPAPTPPSLPLVRPDPPQVLGPAGALVADAMAPLLRWRQQDGVTQFQIRVIPAHDDGPGINLIIGDPVLVSRAEYPTPAPDLLAGTNFILLPGMSYRWEVRVATALRSLAEDAPEWSAWAQGDFRTPVPRSSALLPQTPALDASVATLTPQLTWRNPDPRIFYYEVQVSHDSTFADDPHTARAPLYWELIHGGVTRPLDSYAIPVAMPLDPATLYYWRVRPRVQGDGQPVAWSDTWSFRTPPALASEKRELFR